MTKMIKLSLVAAVAVAGFTTTASAQNLEDAIKGVEVSGFVSYTAEKTGVDTAEMQHDIDIRATFKSKVNDKVTAVVMFDEAQDDDTDSGSQTSSPTVMQIEKAYFTYKNAGISSNFGLMSAPLTDGARADGITVSTKAGALTVGAGYLYNTSLGSQDVAFATVAGKAGPAGFSVAYANLMETDADATAESASYIHANVNMMAGPAKVAFDYSTASGDAIDTAYTNTQSQMKVSANVKAGALSIDVAYAKNGSDGARTMIDGSGYAASSITMASDAVILAKAGADATAMYAAVSTKVGANNTVKLAYGSVTADLASAEETAMAGTFTHAMSKNFKVFANYETYDKNAKETELTLGANYSF